MKKLTFTREGMYQGPLVLVNRAHPLRAIDERALDSFKGVPLERTAARQLRALFSDIHAGNQLVPVSGYRPLAEQQQIYDETLQKEGPDFTAQFVAYPGCSEHQSGLAIDLARNKPPIDFICPDFPYEGICQQFRARMAAFGFIQRYPAGQEKITGIGHEPWHFRYVGQPHAAYIQQHALTLEAYIDLLRSYRYGVRALCFGGAEISYLPLCAGDVTLMASDGVMLAASGNNVDGFIITIGRQ
nr:M15 family metallopeptidase [Maliibacterium massiliense]